jgi:hypothetical protein
VQHYSRHIWILTQRWIANHVYVGETGDAEGVTEARSTGALDIGEDLEIFGDLETGI